MPTSKLAIEKRTLKLLVDNWVEISRAKLRLQTKCKLRLNGTKLRKTDNKLSIRMRLNWVKNWEKRPKMRQGRLKLGQFYLKNETKLSKNWGELSDTENIVSTI